MKRFGRVLKRILLWSVGGILALVLLVFLLIQVPSVQNVIKNKAVKFLEKKIQTKVEIGRLSFDFPKILVLENVYFEDQNQDTLLAGDTLKVDISLFKLLNNVIEINLIDLRGITVNMHNRTPDNLFNFDYIIQAFASDKDKSPSYDSTAAMQFSIDHILLDRIKVNFDDIIGGNKIYANLGHLDTRIEDVDLNLSYYEIPELTINSLDLQVVQSEGLIKNDTIFIDSASMKSTSLYPDLKLGWIDLTDINFNFNNIPTATDANVAFEHLKVEFEKLDLRNQLIKIKDLDLLELNGGVAIGIPENLPVVADTSENASGTEQGWEVTLAGVKIENSNFKFDDLSARKLNRGLDYSHLYFEKLEGELSDLSYTRDTITGSVHELSLVESSGLEIKQLQTDFFYSDTKAYLENLFIETPGSLIKDKIQISYPSIDVLASDIGQLGIDASLIESHISFADMLLFVPSFGELDVFKRNPRATAYINGTVYGKLNNMVIPSLEITGIGSLVIKASGSIVGLPDMSKAYFDLRVDNFKANKNDLKLFIPENTIPSNIYLPDNMQAQGTIKGTMKDLNLDLNLNSSYGAASIDGSLKNITVTGREAYDLDITTNQFDVGKLIGMEDTVGILTAKLSAKGTGFDPKTMDVVFDGTIDQFEYTGYMYQNLVFKGKSIAGVAELDATMRDPNLSFTLVGDANMNGTYPAVNLTLQMDSVHLQKLGLYEKDLRFTGKVLVDLETADPDYLNGSIIVGKSVVTMEGKRYRLDTMSVFSSATAELDTIEIKSEFLAAKMHGQYKLTEVADAMRDKLNTYFSFDGTAPVKYVYDPQQFTFNASLTRSPLIIQVLPDLKEMSDITLSGSFDSDKGEIFAKGGVYMLQYQDYTIDSLQFEVNTEAQALNYNLTFDKISSPSLQILNTSLSGNAKDDKLDILLQVKDVDNRNQYSIGGTITMIDQLTEFSLKVDDMLLNYDPWQVTNGNKIQYGPEGILAQNFVLSNNGQSLTINSTPQVANAPLSIQFKDFSIETFARLVSRDSLLLGGNIDGEAILKDLQTSMVFTSDLTIEDFSFRGDTVGNIQLSVHNQTPNRYDAEMTLSEKGNDVKVIGYYSTAGESGQFDFDVNIATLNLSTIQGFSYDQIKESSGSIDGNLKVTGTIAAPKVRGDLHFSAAEFNVSKFNSYFRLTDELIHFTSDGIDLQNFMILDRAGNEARIDGIIYTKDFRNYTFKLTANSDDFQLLNSTREDNDLYYGKLFVDTRLRIAGTLENPVVDGNVRVKEKTALTIVVPQEEIGLQDREGIVEFVDMDDPEFQEILESARDSLSDSGITGMDISVNISIDKKAELSLIIDEANGDYLKVQGGGELNGGIDQSGKVTLTGSYLLEEGVYSLTFNFIKREFRINKGSSITWVGEPMTAKVDVNAVYVANTAPLDLVLNQLGDAAPTVVNTYKQKLPFEILLSMKGELLKPEITFDILLPKGNYGVSSDVTSTVETKLAQLRTEPAELNKQVFALLLLNRFVSENPFQNSAGGGGVTSLARQSASKLLSEQLNNLVGGMIAGFDLNLDLNSTEDYTSGELKNRTNLTVGLSKRLLSDRLHVSIGSNFELEGAQESNRKTTTIAGNVTAEYQLTKDGRYLLRAYRKDEYIVVQGQVVETGLGFVISADYDQFKDIFVKKSEEDQIYKKEQRKAIKEEKEAERHIHE